ncbi:MAG TPA: hypothetical protein VIK01_24220 [Polyangiaceae bacterium]
MQRASSDLKLNPHLHAVFLDGVYVPGGDGTPEFYALPRLGVLMQACVDHGELVGPRERHAFAAFES